MRFPALGPITGDWGGGYDVGLAGLSAAARSEDGRGPATRLQRLVPAHFGERDAARGSRTRSTWVASPTAGSSSLRRSCCAPRQATPWPPRSATAWSTRSSRSRARTLVRLELVDEHVEVVVGGGLMRGADSELLGRIEAGLRRVGPQLVLRRTSAPPIVGAALLGLDAIGAGREAQARLRSQLSVAVERLEQLEVG